MKSIQCEFNKMANTICFNKARHSLVMKSTTPGFNKKIIARICDKHFYAIKELQDLDDYKDRVSMDLDTEKIKIFSLINPTDGSEPVRFRLRENRI